MMSQSLAEKISDSELEVMRVLWQAGEPLGVNRIREALQHSRGWEATTVKTLVARLTAKGVIRQEKRGVFHYSPLITENEYNSWATDNLIRKLYRGRARGLVAALVQSDGLTREDIEELRQLFRVEE